MLTGRHLIAGEWLAGSQTFQSRPASGDPLPVYRGAAAEIDAAATAAEAAFETWGAADRSERAAFLEAVADGIEALGAEITAIGSAETGLPEARLEGERGRTTGQLRLFARHIRDDAFLDRRHDAALPDRKPAPRPELRMAQRPVGPVAVFGASNFPLAFSTAGGDTAAALAAGCSVVVKGHPAHPGTSELVARAIAAAIERCAVHPGVFSLVQSDTVEAGAALVTHPLIQAVGFTGSLRAGRALFDLCAARPVPIPFFGELGSVNPMFLLPGALAARASEIAAGWAASLTLGAGQFCTNPGVVVAVEGADAQAFAAQAARALGQVAPQTMLSEGIAAACRAGSDAIAASPGVESLVAGGFGPRAAAPSFFRVGAREWLADPALRHEVFGPVGILVTVADVAQMLEIARSLEGQLTCSIHLAEGDEALARALLPILERKAGRILANGFPTGVEVADAMVHGGPYPASTNFGATSVGTLSIRRFLRPVCYQNMPLELLPADFRDGD